MFRLADETDWPRIYTRLDSIDIAELMASKGFRTSQLQWGQANQPLSLRRTAVCDRHVRTPDGRYPLPTRCLGDWIAWRAAYARTSLVYRDRNRPYFDDTIRSSIQYAKLTIHDLRPAGHEPDVLSEEDLHSALQELIRPTARLTEVEVRQILDEMVHRDILRPDFVTDAVVFDPDRFIVIAALERDGRHVGGFQVVNPALRAAIDADQVHPGWLDSSTDRPSDQWYFHFSSLTPILSLVCAFLDVRSSLSPARTKPEKMLRDQERRDAVEAFLGLPSCRDCFRPRREGRWTKRCPACRGDEVGTDTEL